MLNKTKILLGGSLVLNLFLFLRNFWVTDDQSIVNNHRETHENKVNLNYKLKNILDDEATLNISSRHQAFLIETHMNKERELTNAKQACSVESVARMNPDFSVYFLLGTSSDGVNLKLSELVEALLSYTNVKLRYFNPIEFSKGTKLENFFLRGDIEKSKFPLSHLSDVMRALTLNKYGGQYLDLDVINLVPLSIINLPNSACIEDPNYMQPGIMNLDTDENVGRAISNKHLEFLNTKFNPDVWGANGPYMFTDAVKSFCNVTQFNQANGTDCGKFQALPTRKCFPMHYGEWKAVYQEEYVEGVLKRLNETGAHFIHMWNAMQTFDNKTFELKYDSKAAYIELAKLYCPKVYQTIVKYF